MEVKQQVASAKATNRKVKTPKKIIALQHLMERPLYKLDAFYLYGETSLPTTISELYKKHGLIFDREMLPHQHQGNGTTHYTHYTLAKESRLEAQALIDHYTGKAVV